MLGRLLVHGAHEPLHGRVHGLGVNHKTASRVRKPRRDTHLAHPVRQPGLEGVEERPQRQTGRFDRLLRLGLFLIGTEFQIALVDRPQFTSLVFFERIHHPLVDRIHQQQHVATARQDRFEMRRLARRVEALGDQIVNLLLRRLHGIAVVPERNRRVPLGPRRMEEHQLLELGLVFKIEMKTLLEDASECLEKDFVVVRLILLHVGEGGENLADDIAANLADHGIVLQNLA